MQLRQADSMRGRKLHLQEMLQIYYSILLKRSSSRVISLAQRIKNLVDILVLFTLQEEVKRCHRYCNHSGGQAVPKVER